jgi:hypothetical protein
LEAQIRAEEAWINSEIASAEEELRQQNEQRADYALGRTEDGTTQDLVYGMTMGFLLGFLMFFFLVCNTHLPLLVESQPVLV